MIKFGQDSRLRGNDDDLTIFYFILGFAKVSGCAKNLELQRGECYRIDSRAKDVLLVISERVGFSVHTSGGKPLPVETRHVMDNGPPFDSVRAARLKKGRFVLNITQSGTASLICVHADG